MTYNQDADDFEQLLKVMAERHAEALQRALHETYNLKDVTTRVTWDEAHLLGIDPLDPPTFFGYPVIVDGWTEPQ